MKKINEAFRSTLERLLNEGRTTKKELCEVLEIKPATLSRWLRGYGIVYLKHICNLSTKFNMRCDDILDFHIKK